MENKNWNKTIKKSSSQKILKTTHPPSNPKPNSYIIRYTYPLFPQRFVRLLKKINFIRYSSIFCVYVLHGCLCDVCLYGMCVLCIVECAVCVSFSYVYKYHGCGCGWDKNKNKDIILCIHPSSANPQSLQTKYILLENKTMHGCIYITQDRYTAKYIKRCCQARWVSYQST